MCAGRATRFGDICKQLLPIGSDGTILDRQLEQTNEYSPYIVTYTQEISDHVLERGVTVLIPSSHETLCDSILSTQYRWTDRVIILLGDVIYSNKVMQDILTETDPLMFFGDQYEMFALSFSTGSHPEIISALSEGSIHPFGKLRYAYRAFINAPWDCGDKATLLRADPNFHYVSCWITRDCDSPSLYENIKRQLVKTHILETK